MITDTHDDNKKERRLGRNLKFSLLQLNDEGTNDSGIKRSQSQPASERVRLCRKCHNHVKCARAHCVRHGRMDTSLCLCVLLMLFFRCLNGTHISAKSSAHQTNRASPSLITCAPNNAQLHWAKRKVHLSTAPRDNNAFNLSKYLIMCIWQTQN